MASSKATGSDRGAKPNIQRKGVPPKEDGLRQPEGTSKIANETNGSSRKDKGGLQVGFWNIAGLKKKVGLNKKEGLRKKEGEVDYEHELRSWLNNKDIVAMEETWVIDSEWDKVRAKLPCDYTWYAMHAEGGNSGRAKGGFVIGVSKKLDATLKEDVRKDGLFAVELTTEVYGKIKVGVVYRRRRDNLENLTNAVDKWSDNDKDGKYILGGDWNVRVGDGAINEEGEERRRKSKDKKCEPNGRKWMQWNKDKGWDVLNGCTEGDENGEFTYGSTSVIDFIALKNIKRDRVTRMKVENNLGSDHFPVMVEIGGWEENTKSGNEEQMSEKMEKLNLDGLLPSRK